MKRLILLFVAFCALGCRHNPEKFVVNDIFADNELIFSGYLGSPDGPKEMITMTLIIDKSLVVRGYYTSDYISKARNFYGKISEQKGDYSMSLYEINENLEKTGWSFGFQDIDSDELKGRHWSPECSAINNDFFKPYIWEITNIGQQIRGQNAKTYQIIRDVHLVRKRNTN